MTKKIGNWNFKKGKDFLKYVEQKMYDNPKYTLNDLCEEIKDFEN